MLFPKNMCGSFYLKHNETLKKRFLPYHLTLSKILHYSIIYSFYNYSSLKLNVDYSTECFRPLHYFDEYKE